MLAEIADKMGAVFKTTIKTEFIDVFVGYFKEMPGITQFLFHQPPSRTRMVDLLEIALKGSQAPPTQLSKGFQFHVINKMRLH